MTTIQGHEATIDELALRRSNSMLFGVTVLAAGIRGVFEAALDRSLAYAVQLLLICMPLLVIELRSRRVDPLRSWLGGSGPGQGFAWVVLISLVSLLLTLSLRSTAGGQYLLLLLFTWLLLAFSTQQIRNPTLDFRLCFWMSTGVACLLAFVGIAQQLLVFPYELPGYTNLFDVIRPPSLTASYLHYPLIIAIAACNCYVAALNGMRRALVPMIILVLATFGSFSRSGMLILFAAFGFSMLADRRQFIRSLLAMLVIFGLLLILSTQVDSGTLSVLDRLTSSVDTDSDGNDTRYSIWVTALDRLSMMNVGFGTYFGLITNSASEELRDVYGIVESSPLQQILNIGLLGTIIYYRCFYRLARSFPRSDRFSQYILAAAALQSCFYQSIEVIPFLVMIMVTAVLAATYRYDASR